MAQKKDVEEVKKGRIKKGVTNEKKVTKKLDNEKRKTTKKVDRNVVEKKIESEVKKEKNILHEEVSKDVTLTKESKKKNIFNIVLVMVCILFIAIAFGISMKESSERAKYYNTITYNEVETLLNDDEINIIYWASPTCGYCSQFKPVIMNVSSKYKVTFNYLNVSNLTDDQYATMYTYFSAFDEVYNSSNLGTPSLILVQNGEIIDISVGALTDDELVSYLQEKGLIENN